MQFFTTVIALSAAAVVAAQGETRLLTPTGAAPASCTGTVDGKFKITLYSVGGDSAAAKRDLETRQAQAGVECSGAEGSLELELQGGVLTDSKGRIGSIIGANRQFQFDGPPAQAGAIYTGGWSACTNGSLAIGPSANFYRCRSGNFANLYDQPSESECELIAIGVLPCSGTTLPVGSSSAAAPSAPSVSAAVSAPSANAPSASVPSASVPVSSAPAAAETPATTAAPSVSQITDGQIQYPTGSIPMITEITDGQVQAPTVPAMPAPTQVSQIGDGQVQYPTGSVPSAPAAGNGTVSAPVPPIATGAASYTGVSSLVAVVAAVAFALF